MAKMLKIWVLLIGLFGFANILIGWMGAGIDFGVVWMPADWLGYLCILAAVALSLLGRKHGK